MPTTRHLRVVNRVRRVHASAGAPKASKADPPKRSAAGRTRRTAAMPGGGTRRHATTPEARSHQRAVQRHHTESSPAKHGDAENGDRHEPPIVDVKPSTPARIAAADPGDPPEPHARRSSHRPGLTSASAKPAKPIAADPQPSAIGAPSHRSAVAPTQQGPTQAFHQLSAVANIASSQPLGVERSVRRERGPTSRSPGN